MTGFPKVPFFPGFVKFTRRYTAISVPGGNVKLLKGEIGPAHCFGEACCFGRMARV